MPSPHHLLLSVCPSHEARGGLGGCQQGWSDQGERLSAQPAARCPGNVLQVSRRAFLHQFQLLTGPHSLWDRCHLVQHGLSIHAGSADLPGLPRIC